MTKQEKRYARQYRHFLRDKELQKYARKSKKSRKTEIEIVAPGDQTGTVGSIFGPTCLVHVRGGVLTCAAIPGLAVGDEVDMADGRLTGMLERRSCLSRPDPSDLHREKVVAANVDLVVIVGSIASPPLRPGLIDRVLVAAAHGGADAIVCINKIDLCRDLSALDVFRDAGVAVMCCSAATSEGIDELRAVMRARTCVFTGHSGVGKSSLINALFPGIGLGTGEVGKKGRHTTSSSCLHEESDGTRVIDTPGIREFGLWRVGPDQLKRYFPEFAAAGPCRFADCTHTHEPDCSVREAGFPRYRTYSRMLGTLND